MKPLALELSDLDLRLSSPHPSEAAQGVPFSGTSQPGYALLDGETIRFGAEARAVERRFPRRVLNTYWDQLDESPLRPAHSTAQTQADLAYLQLQHLFDQREGRSTPAASGGAALLLAVPGMLDRSQLGLLLGLCKACERPASGLIDLGVASVASALPGQTPLPDPTGEALHLDLRLHRAVITHLHVTEQEIERRGVETCSALGQVSLLAAAAKSLASLFLSRTRFDPLFDAETEQHLYDEIPGCLAALAGPDSKDTTHLRIAPGSRADEAGHTIEVSRSDLSQVMEQSLRPFLSQLDATLSSDEPRTIFLSHRIAALPGLRAALEARAPGRVHTLDRDAALKGCLGAASEVEVDAAQCAYLSRLARPERES